MKKKYLRHGDGLLFCITEVTKVHFVCEYVKNIPVISFTREDGSLLGENVNDFGSSILEVINGGERRLIFDLRRHSYLNSFGLGELINLRNYFLDRDITCTLIVNSQKIIKLFDMVGIGELFETIASEKEI